MPPKTPKKKQKKQNAVSKELVESVVAAILAVQSQHPKFDFGTSISNDANSLIGSSALLRDILKVQEQHAERLNNIEGKIDALRFFAEETKRCSIDQIKEFQDKLNVLSADHLSQMEDERHKRLKLVRTVHKAHAEEISKLREYVDDFKSENTRKSKSIMDDFKKIQDSTDEV